MNIFNVTFEYFIYSIHLNRERINFFQLSNLFNFFFVTELVEVFKYDLSRSNNIYFLKIKELIFVSFMVFLHLTSG